MFNLLSKLRAAKARKVEAERQARLANFRDAVKRGDTRRQHETFPAAREATNAALRMATKGRA